MRRDKTLKVCANHYGKQYTQPWQPEQPVRWFAFPKLTGLPPRSLAVTAEMALSPNVGSDRSWVYNVQADVSEGAPTAETLAIRFANSDSKSTLSPPATVRRQARPPSPPALTLPRRLAQTPTCSRPPSSRPRRPTSPSSVARPRRPPTTRRRARPSPRLRRRRTRLRPPLRRRPLLTSTRESRPRRRRRRSVGSACSPVRLDVSRGRMLTGLRRRSFAT